MDSFSKHTPRTRSVDGFISNGSGNRLQPRPMAAGRPAMQTGRRLDDFRRADGFHAAPRRAVTQAPIASKREDTLPTGLNLDLPDNPKARGKKKKQAKLTGVQKFRRWALRTTALSVAATLVIGGFLVSKGYLKLHKAFQGGSQAVALTDNVDPTQLKGEGDGRVNILLMGAGGANHNGGDLTDTLMIASVDPVNNQAALVSIPRDLWTKMPNNYISSYQKINAAYESGKYKYLGKQDQKNADHKAILAGFGGIDSTIERVTGIPIHYNILVDFQAFAQAVDTVGGVTVNVPEKLYDPTMAWENNRNPVLANIGLQTFDGKHALMYARSRETTSDFARGQRQRQLLMALKDKTANLGTLTNPLKLSQLLSAFGDNVQSDVSISDMTRMATLMKKIPSNSIQSVGLTDQGANLITTGNINGMSVVMPKAGLEDYSKIQEYVRTKLKDGYIAKENANITILNGSGTAGLASTKAEELKSYGYNIGTIANAPTEDYATTQIIDLSNGSKKYTVNYLKKRFGVQEVSKVLPQGIVAGGANIVIILGSDATLSQQN